MAEPIFISGYFLDYILPFVLVFTLIFAILTKTKLLGEDKKQINAKTTNITMPIHHALMPVSDRNDTINDPYAPPLKTHDIY